MPGVWQSLRKHESLSITSHNYQNHRGKSRDLDSGYVLLGLSGSSERPSQGYDHYLHPHWRASQEPVEGAHHVWGHMSKS